EITASTTELLARSQSLAAPPAHRNALGNGVFGNCTEASSPQPGAIADGAELWLVTIAHAEFLCGEEDVYGKLCEQACVTSTDRPLRIEGVVLRARPLALAAPLVTSSGFALTAKHLRSRVASAYFADERARPASLVSGSGLR